MILDEIKRELQAAGNAQSAAKLQRFFKTGPGEYSEGDIFIGVSVPEQRAICTKYFKIATVHEATELLRSPIHEHRLTALLILVAKYQKGSSPELRKQIFEIYDAHTAYCNNWDLVDSSAHHIVGAYSFETEGQFLPDMACSDSLWRNRIAMVACLYYIRKRQIEPVFEVARLLLSHRHDLIHKATGWMLREAGKVSQPAVYAFLRDHYADMPRTALRYAIEKYPEEERKLVLAGQFRV